MSIVFIADFFAEQVLGGGELNNEELINILSSRGHEVFKVNSHVLTPQMVEENRDKKFIIANFVNIPANVMPSFYNKQYIIYEHDHKYLTTRNPGDFPDFVAPKEHVINLEFYQNASAVLCQSSFHSEIARKNTDLDNLEMIAEFTLRIVEQSKVDKANITKDGDINETKTIKELVNVQYQVKNKENKLVSKAS